MYLHVAQKRLRFAKLFGMPTRRHEKPIEASQYRRIIVEKTDHIWAWSNQNKCILRSRPTQPYETLVSPPFTGGSVVFPPTRNSATHQCFSLVIGRALRVTRLVGPMWRH